MCCLDGTHICAVSSANGIFPFLSIQGCGRPGDVLEAFSKGVKKLPFLGVRTSFQEIYLLSWNYEIMQVSI